MNASFRVLLAVLLAGAALAWTPSSATAGAKPTRSTEMITEIFTGTRAGQPVEVGTRTRYTIEVEQVFGESTITTERVQVFTTQTFEQCGRGNGPTDSPTDGPTVNPPTAETRYVFRVPRVDEELVATECQSVRLATDATIKALEANHGPGREPGTTTPPVDEFADVGYRCPETGDPVIDVKDTSSCSALADSSPFNRAAAPGLALILVGVLGLVVVRRLGRGRSH